MSEQLFVYGTLRPPQEGVSASDSLYYSEIADYVESHCPATLPNATLYNLGEYPAARPGTNVIQGDLLLVAPEALKITDIIEEHPTVYTRKRATVETADGPIQAWVYWVPEPIVVDQPIIANGDWFKRVDPILRSHVERFAQSDCSWMSTVRPDGRTHLAPMWHVWHRGGIYINTPANSVKVANLAQNPTVSISHPDPSNVILIEGQAVEANEMQEVLKPLFQAKYDWDITTDNEYNTVIEITPLKMMAWNKGSIMRWSSAEILQVW